MEVRLENDSDINALFARIINTDGWPQTKENTNLSDEGLETLHNDFCLPLGFLNGTIEELLDQWHTILDYAELLFCLLISNAKVARLFSFMNRVKSGSRVALRENRLNSQLRIRIEGPKPDDVSKWANFSKIWANGCATSRRPNQQPRKGYQVRDRKEKPKTLIDHIMDSQSTSTTYTQI